MKRFDEEIFLTLGGSIPVCGLKAFKTGEPNHFSRIRGKVDGAILTEGLSPEIFRELARNLLKTEKAEIKDGNFRIKGS